MAKTANHKRSKRSKQDKSVGGRLPGRQWVERSQNAYEKLIAGKFPTDVIKEVAAEHGVSLQTARVDLRRAYDLLQKAMTDELPVIGGRIYTKFWQLSEKAEKDGELDTARKCLANLCTMFGLQDLPIEQAKRSPDERARALTPRERQEQLLEVIANNPELLRLLAERHPEALRAMVGSNGGS